MEQMFPLQLLRKSTGVFQFVTDNRAMITKAENARSLPRLEMSQSTMQYEIHIMNANFQGDRRWRNENMPSNITLARKVQMIYNFCSTNSQSLVKI